MLDMFCEIPVVQSCWKGKLKESKRKASKIWMNDLLKWTKKFKVARLTEY